MMFKKIVYGMHAALVAAALVIVLVDRVPTTAQAMTVHGTDKKTMLTVPLEAGMEAVVTLDHITGDMTGYVLNRTNGQFFIRYRYNLTQDFPQHQGAYLMAAGLADFRGFKSNDRMASGVIYVSEETSGRVCAYAIPWNPQFATSGAPNQNLTFIPLDHAQTRFIELR
ncbi:hypothetical protein [Rubripirellula reticaptiva]|uniref:Uncharacterized protein n=1 Tax=Rubripirellula reticaptiva TaxID=2528013 RepID=A0A5C6F3Z4_9BACT|nr:hypothetical protein [Rubripirellula reticaptiva]TWU55895.1 hypothetical protein Poly59_21980 [Rubripirellula reticaptiva]